MNSWDYKLYTDGDVTLPCRGLQNLGNTCYLNALICGLSAVPLVVAWATEHTELERSRSDCPPACP